MRSSLNFFAVMISLAFSAPTLATCPQIERIEDLISKAEVVHGNIYEARTSHLDDSEQSRPPFDDRYLEGLARVDLTGQVVKITITDKARLDARLKQCQDQDVNERSRKAMMDLKHGFSQAYCAAKRGSIALKSQGVLLSEASMAEMTRELSLSAQHIDHQSMYMYRSPRSQLPAQALVDFTKSVFQHLDAAAREVPNFLFHRTELQDHLDHLVGDFEAIQKRANLDLNCNHFPPENYDIEKVSDSFCPPDAANCFPPSY